MMAGASLYIVVEAGATAGDRLAAVLASCDVPTVLITATGEDSLDAAVAKPLVDLAQANGVAALIDDNAALARTLRADGVHLNMSKSIVARYEEAREIVGSGCIVGASAGKSRHDAMELGEVGADYIAFGAPAGLRDREGAEQRRRDMIVWWAELFEIPCVAFDVADPGTAAELASLGADFIGCRLDAGLSVADARDKVAAYADAVGTVGAEVEP